MKKEDKQIEEEKEDRIVVKPKSSDDYVGWPIKMTCVQHSVAPIRKHKWGE